ncbi:MAG: OmpA family protein [Deltaproteobacteria bacterium]|nr:OmpA family protein [Deltaproteobacteria bacterium]
MRMIALMMVFTLAACPKKPEPPPPVITPPAVVETVKKPVVEEVEAIEIIKRNFQRVHFEYDSTSLTEDSLTALRENADILQTLPGLRIEVQGHADERGTTEYNMALGQKRGQGIADKLSGMGVSRDRIAVISYGEERPLATGESESVWSQNRRAEFRVLSTVPNAEISGTIR